MLLSSNRLMQCEGTKRIRNRNSKYYPRKIWKPANNQWFYLEEKFNSRIQCQIVSLFFPPSVESYILESNEGKQNLMVGGFRLRGTKFQFPANFMHLRPDCGLVSSTISCKSVFTFLSASQRCDLPNFLQLQPLNKHQEALITPPKSRRRGRSSNRGRW